MRSPRYPHIRCEPKKNFRKLVIKVMKQTIFLQNLQKSEDSQNYSKTKRAILRAKRADKILDSEASRLLKQNLFCRSSSERKEIIDLLRSYPKGRSLIMESPRKMKLKTITIYMGYYLVFGVLIYTTIRELVK